MQLVGGGKKEQPAPVSQSYVSPGRKFEGNAGKSKTSPSNVTVSAGDGNVTSGAVGAGTPQPGQVKVTAYESAWALGALTATANTASIIHNDFRIPSSFLER